MRPVHNEAQGLEAKISWREPSTGEWGCTHPLEFCLLQGEVAEAFDAWRKGLESLGEELADVMIYFMT
jgi:NTP pyrophosphatase (non-canonical NTP hydrolase)